VSATALVAIDWGTTSARAYRLDGAGAVQARQGVALGIKHVRDGRFEPALATLLGDWSALPVPRVAAGMIGSRQGWIEVPYLECPASFEALGAHMLETPRRELAIVPGLLVRDAEGVPDVMRGEETQLAGATGDDASMLAVLPGTHSKWARVERGRIVDFASYMTGELYAVLLAHSILGRLAHVAAVPASPGASFDAGVSRGLATGGLGHRIFAARTLALTGALDARDVPDYLSGVLIGDEIAAARAWAARGNRGGTGAVCVIGADALVDRYVAALAIAGIPCQRGPADAAVRGLTRIARLARRIE
jgi:2-dehydro-3-deoxygalactonokinase